MFDAADRVKGVIEMLTSMVGSGVRIVADLDCDPCPVEADPNQFETALLNLAVNARDAMPDGGEIVIEIDHVTQVPPLRGDPARPGQYVAVSVRDTGSGIASDQLRRIFEPFFTTKEVGKGTGLGLSQVFGFAKQSEGDIDVDSIVGQGATFTLYLPSARVGQFIRKQPERSSNRNATNRGRGRVLIVEDNRAVGEFAFESLTELGYAATLVGDGNAALALLETRHSDFDVVFSDVVMPGLNGVELARLIRQQWPQLPIILTSGYSHILAEEADHGFQLIQKPYTIDTVDQALRTKALVEIP